MRTTPKTASGASAASPNEVLAQRVRSVRLDVLIDLNGYSRQARLPLFLYRAARRQVAWFNSYATAA